MKFDKTTQALDIPPETTAEFTFNAPGRPVLTCKHAGDGNPGWLSALAKHHPVAAARGATEQERSRVAREDYARLIADACVVSWTGVIDDETNGPAPCTPDNVCDYLVAVIRARGGGSAEWVRFTSWIGDASTFLAARPDAAALGKP